MGEFCKQLFAAANRLSTKKFFTRKNSLVYGQGFKDFGFAEWLCLQDFSEGDDCGGARTQARVAEIQQVDLPVFEGFD